MKKRSLIVIAALAVVALLWLLWGRNKPASSVTPPPKATPAEVAKSTAPTPSASPVVVAGKPVSQAQLREIMNSANQPISFFGKVIDQDGNPIPDVKVTFEIRYMKEIGPVGIGDTFDYPSTITGPDGCFALMGAKGSVMGVKSLEKVGYDPSEKSLRRSFWYWRDQNPYRPDPENPVIFHMWKKAGAEKLVRNGIGHAIQYDGTPTSFDLLTGRVTNNGDLRVTLVRNPEKIQWGQKNYEWTATIAVPDGGLIASTADQMYLAPAEGYQNKITLHMPANDPQWTATKEVGIYLKLRDGKYYGRAKLEFMVGSDRPTTPFSITSFVNPSGSRNLEYDPLQDVNENSRINQSSSKP